MNQNPYPPKNAKLSPTVTVRQALETSPPLARLAELIEESSARLKAVESLIPEALRSAIKAGPIDGDSWCLLVNSNAAAAKLRQLCPLLLNHLTAKGSKITSIRLKILMESR